MSSCLETPIATISGIGAFPETGDQGHLDRSDQRAGFQGGAVTIVSARQTLHSARAVIPFDRLPEISIKEVGAR